MKCFLRSIKKEDKKRERERERAIEKETERERHTHPQRELRTELLGEHMQPVKAHV
jgi:hypothetical protein